MLEAEGITTLTIGSVRPHIEKVAPPRGLVCDFPLGRPLGKPDDPEFQTSVLEALFTLAETATEPTVTDFPEVIEHASAEPLACALPPRLDPDEHPAIDEARALKSAYERGVASYGDRVGPSREITPDQVPDAIAAFVRVNDGTDWQKAGIPGNPMRVAQDIRGYYQTAALALAEHSPDAWAGDDWFYDKTETGKLMLATRSTLKAGGAPQPVWFYLSPGDRPA